MAASALAGTQANCSCGQPISVPGTANPGDLFDELAPGDFTTPKPAETDEFSLAPAAAITGNEETDKSGATAFTYAMRRISAGAKPNRVCQELMTTYGMRQMDAETIVHSAMPDDMVQTMIAKRQGVAAMKYGAILFAAGIVIAVGSAIAFQGSLIILAFGLLLGGLGTLLYGLFSYLLGKR